MRTCAILAATLLLAGSAMTVQTSTAEAGLRHMFRGHHGGGLFRRGPRLGLIGRPRPRFFALHHHRRHHHRPRILAPIVAAPVVAAPVVAAPRMPASLPRQPQALPPPQNADNQGRVFDPASMSWFDGINQCWAGQQAWGFQNGTWSYGASRWYPADGTWLTDAAKGPTPIDCQTVPRFAQASQPAPLPQAVPTAGQRNEPAGPLGAASSAQCTRYLANLGRSIAVPCGG